MTRDELAAALVGARWRYAATMPQWPHVYTVRDWWADHALFVAACAVIEQEGCVIAWPPPPSKARYHNTYLVVGELKLWAMGPTGDRDGVHARTVLNCARASPADLAYTEGDKVNQTGAWSDLATRLSELLQP